MAVTIQTVLLIAVGCLACFTQAQQPTCQDKICPTGQFCKMQEVQCVTTPCYPMPTCLPMGTCPPGLPFTPDGAQWDCGLLGGSPCPSGYECITDPVDGFAVCCRKDDVGTCPFGSPYSVGGIQLNCGDQVQSCPSGWTCRYNANPFGVCCPIPQPERVCEFGPPLIEGGVEIPCGNSPYETPCPKGWICNTDLQDASAVCCPEEEVPKPTPKPNVIIIVCVVLACVVAIIVIIALCFCCPSYCGDWCYTPRRRRRCPKMETKVTHVYPQPSSPAPLNFLNSMQPACNCHTAPVAPPCTCQVQSQPSCNCTVMAMPSCKYSH